MRFRDRSDAGRQLALRLARYRAAEPVVIALPRGGVPVGYEVAQALHAPLDVVVARKLGAPGYPELGVGAVAEGGAAYLDARTLAALGVTRDHLREVARAELAEVARRQATYRGGRPPLEVARRVTAFGPVLSGTLTREAMRWHG